MSLSNIRKGLTKVLIGQILDLIAALLTFLVSVLFFGNLFNPNVAEFSADDTEIIIRLLLASGLTVISMLLFVSASLMYIFGLIQASKDEIIFRVSLICFCVCLPLKILTMYFIHRQSSLMYLADTISTLIYMMAVLYLIQGIRRTADRLDDKKMEKRGDILFRIMTVSCVTEAFSEIAVIIVNNTPAEVVTPALSITANVLSFVQYGMIIMYLVNVLRILKKEKKAAENVEVSENIPEN